MTTTNYPAGKTVKIASDVAVTIGKLVTVHPVGTGATPDSGAIPPADGPTLGVVVSAFLSSTPGAPPFAHVQLMAPGKPNHGRIVGVYASDVAD